MVESPATQNLEARLDGFASWLVGRGRTAGTAALYVTNVRRCLVDPRGVTHRLVSGRLAPNTARANRAALAAWALHTKDAELTATLADLRLPPARRLRSKPPLDMAQWRTVLRYIDTCETESVAMRQVLGIVARRGLRSGDVLRMRKSEIRYALATGKLPFEAKGRKRLEFEVTPIRRQLELLGEIPGGWKVVRDLISRSKDPKVASVKVWRAARRTAKAVQIDDMNPHRYRHTVATRFLEALAGDPNAILKLQKYMSWENMQTAARYVDSVSQSELDEIGNRLVAGLE